jgi:hypothetical protein
LIAQTTPNAIASDHYVVIVSLSVQGMESKFVPIDGAELLSALIDKVERGALR